MIPIAVHYPDPSVWDLDKVLGLPLVLEGLQSISLSTNVNETHGREMLERRTFNRSPCSQVRGNSRSSGCGGKRIG